MAPQVERTVLQFADCLQYSAYLIETSFGQDLRTFDVEKVEKLIPDTLSGRDQVLESMERVMGPLPDRSNTGPVRTRVVEETDLGDVVRRKIAYSPEPGDLVPAYLLMPKDASGQSPAVMCLHQTVPIGKEEPIGLGGKPNLRYGIELARRGYVTLSPDYPNFGEYAFDPYSNGYASASMKGIFNHMRGVDLLQSLPEVDPDRIGCIGHSLGGHNTIFLGVFDTRVKAMVSSCGFTSFSKYKGGDLTGWTHKGYMPRIAEVFGKEPSRMPFDFADAIGALAPRAFFTNSPLGDANFDVSGVRDCIQAAGSTYEEMGVSDRLVAVHPDAGHDFPPDVRSEAYAFIDRHLRG